MTDFELGWLVGLLEGEGCFGLTGYRSGENKTTPIIQLAMTDLDVVRRAAAILGGGQKEPRVQLAAGQMAGTDGPIARKTVYRWRVAGKRAIEVMRLVLPHMGERRSARIREIFDRSGTTKALKMEALSASLRL